MTRHDKRQRRSIPLALLRIGKAHALHYVC
jgi:hypothetical protein